MKLQEIEETPCVSSNQKPEKQRIEGAERKKPISV
jgi:hypothetical protein